MKKLLIAVLAGCALGAIGAAHAQPTIYRCGTTYSEHACADGTAVQGLGAPAASDVAASRTENERQAKAADAMEKARLREEAKPVSAYIPKEKVEETPKLHTPEVFVVRAPADKRKSSAKKKKKAA